MENLSCHHTWIHGHTREDARHIVDKNSLKHNGLVGVSYQTPYKSMFPRGGLVPAMQAAIRGELDFLLITDEALLGKNANEIQEIVNAFAYYGVQVKSCSKTGSKSS